MKLLHLFIICFLLTRMSYSQSVIPNINWKYYSTEKGDLEVPKGSEQDKIVDLDGDSDYDILLKPYAFRAPEIDIWLQNRTGFKQ